MGERQESVSLHKKEIKFPASIGDWTTYKPLKPAARKIKPFLYGFHRISGSELETTLKVHHFFSIEFARYLKDAIKASIDIFSISIEQLTYLDFLKRVTGGLIYNKLALENIGEVLFLIDYQLANIVINFSLGSQTADTKIKELTELEESIIQSIFGNVLEKYSGCWRDIFKKPALEIISYPNIQRETNINLNEIITVVSAQVSIANSVPASYTFVYQNNVLKKLTELLWKKEESAPLNLSALPEELLNAIEIPMIAELGTTSISTQELTEIENEDVISLDQKLNEPIRLVFGYSSQFVAQPGIKNNRQSVRLLSSSIKKIKAAPIIKPEIPAEPVKLTEPLIAEESKVDLEIPQQEEDLEFPLEGEEKEEYNEASEELFEEENNTQP